MYRMGTLKINGFVAWEEIEIEQICCELIE